MACADMVHSGVPLPVTSYSVVGRRGRACCTRTKTPLRIPPRRPRGQTGPAQSRRAATTGSGGPTTTGTMEKAPCGLSLSLSLRLYIVLLPCRIKGRERAPVHEDRCERLDQTDSNPRESTRRSDTRLVSPRSTRAHSHRWERGRRIFGQFSPAAALTR